MLRESALPSSSSSSNRKFNYQQRVSGHVRVIIRRITTSKRRLNGLLYGRVSPADSRSIGKKLGKIRIDSIIHLSFVLCLVFLLLGCRKKVEGKLVGFFIVTILNFVLKGRGEEKKWIRWMYSRLTIIVCIFSWLKRYREFIEIYRVIINDKFKYKFDVDPHLITSCSNLWKNYRIPI